MQKFTKESIAIVAEDFLKMKAKTEGREFIKPYNIIYIYSNHIDKTGDDKTSECDVFKATKDEFDYLMKIIKQIAGMNGINMLITSDHGYLYQQNRLDETDLTDFTLQAKYIKPAIADKIFPRQLRAAFYTTSGKLISDSASFIFNSNDKDAAAREQRKTFLFISDASKYNSQEVILKNVPVYVLEYLLGMYCSTDGIDVTCRSIVMEPVNLDENTKWHLVARIIPFVEKNYNIYELGPRGTEKSYVYDEISPYSILISGGQTTVANLFYNMSSRTVGLVGLWDVVAFDEVAGINMKDKDGTQIMKGFMANGSFCRGKESINTDASMVFVGNINGSIKNLVKTSHLLSPFPKEMIDTAFFDRFHHYLPGWEIPKMRPEFFTNSYGFISDYYAECLRELRKHNFSDAINQYFRLGKDLNQRDTIAVKRTVSGLVKLLFPDGKFTMDDIRKCLEYALVGRRRTKEQINGTKKVLIPAIDMIQIGEVPTDLIACLYKSAISDIVFLVIA